MSKLLGWLVGKVADVLKDPVVRDLENGAVRDLERRVEAWVLRHLQRVDPPSDGKKPQP